MTRRPLQSDFSGTNVGEITKCLDRFDGAWLGDSPPAIDDFLRHAGDTAARRELLLELIVVDLEHRWRRAAEKRPHADSAGDRSLPVRPLLEDYVSRYPDLGSIDELHIELIAEESP